MNIIEMAKEAGAIKRYWGEGREGFAFHSDEQLEAFAALVRAEDVKEDLEVLENLRKEIIAQCEAGMIDAYKLGRAEALDEAAKVCESFDSRIWDEPRFNMADECAAAIRGMK